MNAVKRIEYKITDECLDEHITEVYKTFPRIMSSHKKQFRILYTDIQVYVHMTPKRTVLDLLNELTDIEDQEIWPDAFRIAIAYTLTHLNTLPNGDIIITLAPKELDHSWRCSV